MFRSDQLREQVEDPGFLKSVKQVVSCFQDALVYDSNTKSMVSLSGKSAEDLKDCLYLGEFMDGSDLEMHVTGRVSNKSNLPTHITVSESPADAQAEQLRVVDSAGVGESIGERPTVGNMPGAILPHPDAA